MGYKSIILKQLWLDWKKCGSFSKKFTDRRKKSCNFTKFLHEGLAPKQFNFEPISCHRTHFMPLHSHPENKRGVEREQLHEMSYCEICLTLSGGCKLHWRAINEKWTAINICDPRRRSHYNSFTFQILRGRFKIQSRCLSRFDFKKPPQSCYCNKYTLFAIFRIGER